MITNRLIKLARVAPAIVILVLALVTTAQAGNDYTLSAVGGDDAAAPPAALQGPSVLWQGGSAFRAGKLARSIDVDRSDDAFDLAGAGDSLPVPEPTIFTSFTPEFTYDDGVVFDVGVANLCIGGGPSGLGLTGWDADEVGMAYDRNTDTLYLGISMWNDVIAGDPENNGNPNTSHPCLLNSGGADIPNLGDTEGIDFILDVNGDGLYDYIAGVPRFSDLSSYTVAVYVGVQPPNAVAGVGFGPDAGISSSVVNNPVAGAPNFEVALQNFSALLGTTTDDTLRFCWISRTGSQNDDGFGEDMVPNASCYDTQLKAFDFGDAPEPSYPTLLASNGARHVIDPDLFLGAGVDGDFVPSSSTPPTSSTFEGQPSLNADGDDNDAQGDDEDGVTFLTPLTPGSPAQVRVTASAPGVLSAWIDFNGDGSWSQAGDNLFPGGAALTAGANTLTFAVPLSAVDDMVTYARFRFTTAGAVGFTGEAPNGEVEDYLVAIPDVLPDITVIKTNDANGDGSFSDTEEAPANDVVVTFQATIINNAPEDVTIDSLADDIHDLSGSSCQALIGTTLPANGTVTCTFAGLVSIDSGFTETDTVTVQVSDNEGNSDADSDDSTVILQPASLGDFVWEDLDADGIQDGGEPGIGGVRVNLYDGAGNPLATTTTDADGFYLFDNLLPGDYRLTFVAPGGYLFSPQDQGANNALDSDANPATGQTIVTTLASGENDLTWDAGLYRLAALGDYVWEDLDADGIQDSGEPGLPSVTVDLYDGDGNLVATTTTGPSGLYSFQGLTPGDYSLDFTPPAGYLFSPRDRGGDDALDSDANRTTGQTIVTTLTSGENDLTWDAGLYRPAALGDFVWRDMDADGIQDAGEPGIAGVVVDLYEGDGAPVAMTTTGPGGLYSFEGLTPGDYYVEFVAPAGYEFSPQDQGANDAVDSDANRTTGQTIVTTLTSGENDLTWDAGLFQRASLGDFVWQDLNFDGRQQAGEPGIPGVAVNLYNGAGGLIATTGADGDGFYLFANLLPGDYYLTFVAPTGYAFSPQDQGANDALDSDANPTTGQTAVTRLTSGENDLTWDAGLAGADLSVIKDDAGYDPAPEDGIIVYTIEICNHGPGIAQDIEIMDSFSAGLTFLGTTAPNCGVTAGTIGPADFACFYGSLLSADQCVSYSFTYEADLFPAAEYKNCVEVGSVITPEPVDVYPNLDCEATEAPPPTGVPVSGFTAVQQGANVALTWQALSSDLAGFRLLRTTTPDIAADPVVVADLVAPRPDGEYQFVDEGVTAGERYFYWLLLLENSGEERVVASAQVQVWPLQARHTFLPMVF